MTATLICSNQGIPLHIVEKEAFADWQKQQSDLTQQWLKTTHYKGEGLAIVPDASGQIALALFVADNLDDYFTCGDLPRQLPKGQYHLIANSQLQMAIAFGFALGGYQFNRYKKDDNVFAVLAIDDQNCVDQVVEQVKAVSLVRDLVNTPAADMMPEHLSQVMQELAEQFGGQFSEIVGDDLLQHNYPTIHAVGRASVHQPRLLDLTWGPASAPKITLVGKGVCFDSGGLDIKPAAGMRNMKKDMGGAAHVLGLARLIMSAGLPIRLRVLVSAVENAVAGNAFRPGDVITTRLGKTVEIDNTDAEGRLVMCDALAEADSEKPELIIDFATLTGAMRVALGTELPGFFATDDDVANAIQQLGWQCSDPVWRQPLYQPYKALLKSDIADMTNCATSPFGGAITAALYLQEFVSKTTPWVHFDVMAFNIRPLPGRPIGGEAVGIRAVFQYLNKRYC